MLDDRTMQSAAPREMVIVGYDGVELLDVTGPASVFGTATRLLDGRAPGYRVQIAAPEEGPFTAEGGVQLLATRALRSLRRPIDTLLVAGGDIDAPIFRDARFAKELGQAATYARRTGSVCTGALLLARAGLLDGRRATTHWYAGQAMRDRHPRVKVDEAAIYVRDGDVWTSAGVTAGLDLCLALVEEDHGHALALAVARWLVLYLRRSGGQTQFSVPLSLQCAQRDPLRELQSWVTDHLSSNLSVEALARRVFMSPRNFARTFLREVGMTPAAYVETMRVEAARHALETTDHGFKQIAARTGLGTPETFSRVFRRRMGVTPSDYRARFQKR
jgi:transcriptional regulator GlxA family with amidase domain